MWAEMLAYTIYLEMPEFPKYVMYLVYLKYSGPPQDIRICEILQVLLSNGMVQSIKVLRCLNTLLPLQAAKLQLQAKKGSQTQLQARK